jgi:hypothetical protein
MLVYKNPAEMFGAPNVPLAPGPVVPIGHQTNVPTHLVPHLMPIPGKLPPNVSLIPIKPQWPPGGKGLTVDVSDTLCFHIADNACNVAQHFCNATKMAGSEKMCTAAALLCTAESKQKGSSIMFVAQVCLDFKETGCELVHQLCPVGSLNPTCVKATAMCDLKSSLA